MLPLRLVTRALALALALFAGAYLIYFVDHARNLLAFPYPLDYGEGPLVAQVEALLAGTPIWRLYADPGASPYLIVNYPPLYLLLTAALAPLAGSPLAAGRLISLAATLGCVAALGMLAAQQRRAAHAVRPSSFIAHPSSFLPLLFLAIPIVREWSALMRVDMLGICLGLWGLVILSGGKRITPARAVGAGLLFTACLFTKPSLIAAPGAAVAWLAWRWLVARQASRSAVESALQGRSRPSPALPRPGSSASSARGASADAGRDTLVAGLSLVGTMALAGGLGFALLEWASGGWFALHVVAANANTWELALARGFWRQQFELRWALVVAAAAAALLSLRAGQGPALLLPVLYTALGAVAAAGVGKVGAYSNYFLELYAGLVWLITVGATVTAGATVAAGQPHSRLAAPPGPLQRARSRGDEGKTPQQGPAFYVLRATLYALLLASLIYYPPLWDATRLRPAGLIEPSPPRLAFGRYGLWADAGREAALLAAQARVGAALTAEVKAAGGRVFTDMPGVAAAAGATSRLQAFEARQLLDQGLAGEAALLHELANGELPLAVIDYLGNWLTPGVITILQRRYAHDGSLGTFDLYRPVDAGPRQAAQHNFSGSEGSLLLAGYSLAPPAGAAYEPGETLALGLTWRRDGYPGQPVVVLRLTTPEGYPLLTDERPLLYGVFSPDAWPEGEEVEHMQPLALPAELPAGRYELTVALRFDASGEPETEQQMLASINVAEQGGAWFAESGRFVPARLMQAWAELGGPERVGLPLTPAVPFSWGRLQCFERACLELRGDAVRQRPLGARLYLAETLRGEGCSAGEPLAGGLCPGFAAAPEQYGELGAPVSGELERNGWIVQWTEYARLERRDGEAGIGLGRLGDESLRLPPGTPYRWP